MPQQIKHAITIATRIKITVHIILLSPLISLDVPEPEQFSMPTTIRAGIANGAAIHKIPNIIKKTLLNLLRHTGQPSRSSGSKNRSICSRISIMLKKSADWLPLADGTMGNYPWRKRQSAHTSRWTDAALFLHFDYSLLSARKAPSAIKKINSIFFLDCYTF